jgi:type IX secretion system PorP/SprF family membrane protein
MRIIRIAVQLILFCSFIGSANGQGYKYYSHSLSNLYLYNPAFSGTSGYGVININQRNQWVGFEGAPILTALSWNMPDKKNKTALGFVLENEKTSLLLETNARASYTYRIPLKEDVTTLRFGLAAGINHSGLDKSQAENPNDPAIINAKSSVISPVAQFGILLDHKTYQIGLSLPELFSKTDVSAKVFSTQFAGFKNLIFSASSEYTLVKKKWNYQPRIFMGLSNGFVTAELQNIFKYKKNSWAGISYRLNSGVGISGGIRKDKISFGYGYQVPVSGITSLAGGSHELFLTYHTTFHKVKPKKKPKPKPDIKKPDIIVVKTDSVKKDSVITIVEEVVTPPEIVDQITDEKLKKEKIVVASRGDHPMEMEEGFYVIAGSFTVQANASKYKDRLNLEGRFAEMGYNSDKELFYVYILKTHDVNVAAKTASDSRQEKEFEKAWVFRIE